MSNEAVSIVLSSVSWIFVHIRLDKPRYWCSHNHERFVDWFWIFWLFRKLFKTEWDMMKKYLFFFWKCMTKTFLFSCVKHTTAFHRKNGLPSKLASDHSAAKEREVIKQPMTHILIELDCKHWNADSSENVSYLTSPHHGLALQGFARITKITTVQKWFIWTSVCR